MLSAMPLPPPVPDTLTLSPLFGDHAVLQRGRPIPVFGLDRPGTAITVRLDRFTARTTADEDGTWRVEMPEMKAGGPYVLTVDGSRQLSVKDVMIGEVWIASGQSNMEWTIDAGTDMADEKKSPPSRIRMIKVAQNAATEPARTIRGAWTVAAPQTVGSMSAVGYSFARELERELNVPVGIVSTNWGGTPAESWTSLAALDADPKLRPQAERFRRSGEGYPEGLAAYRKAIAAYQSRLYPELDDPGEFAAWTDPGLDESGWTPVALPHLWPMELDGVIWYRIALDLTPEQAARPTTLHLGAIDDADETWINGRRVGRTDMTTPNFYSAPREYAVPAGVLRPGRNVIAVRVFDFGGTGGFTSPGSELRLGDVPLTKAVMREERRYASDARVNDPAPMPPIGPGDPQLPTSLFNGMIAPLIPFGIRGAIWYQGESNVGRGEEYERLFPAMIADWRGRWGVGDFPFYFVQLASFQARKPSGEPSAWAELRESQRRTLVSSPNTGMATIIELGEADNVHPRAKREVGRRLALQALRRTYGQRDLVSEGPHPPKIEAAGGELRLAYEPGTGLKTTDGRAPVGFAIAGEDGKFVPAEARIEGERIVLRADGVSAPKWVRYAWADNPEVNLVGATGLPAIPFRSDPDAGAHPGP